MQVLQTQVLWMQMLWMQVLRTRVLWKTPRLPSPEVACAAPRLSLERLILQSFLKTRGELVIRRSQVGTSSKWVTAS